MAGVGYDIGLSSSLATGSQGAAGGGNVFNAAPLFGNYDGTGGSSFGNNPATTPGGNAAAAAKGSSADAGGQPTGTGPGVLGTVPALGLTSPPTTAAAASLTKYLPLVLIGGLALGALWWFTRK